MHQQHIIVVVQRADIVMQCRQACHMLQHAVISRKRLKETTHMIDRESKRPYYSVENSD
jgi:hypothetical protein